MRIVLLILLIFNLLACNPKQQAVTDDGRQLIMLVYGLPDFEKQQVEMVIAGQYGFKFKTVAGCVVSDALRDSVATENQKTEAILVQRFGKEWKFRFYTDVNRLFGKQLQFVSETRKFD